MSIPSLSLDGQVVVITGGRQGLGKAIALTLGEAGADIAVCDKVIEDGQLALVGKEIQNLGRRSLTVQTDVARKADVDNLIQRVMDEFGHIDILVNNAGVTGKTLPIFEQDEDDWDIVINTNLKGAFFCSQAVRKVMVNQKKGNIINITSVAGLSQGFGNVYAISKAGLVRMTRILAWELGKHNVRVNAIAPSLVKTGMGLQVISAHEATKAAPFELPPLSRVCEPSDIASAALFLASEASSYITGHTLVVDGGFLA